MTKIVLTSLVGTLAFTSAEVKAVDSPSTQQHWAFQQRQKVSPPSNTLSQDGLDWAQSPIDLFIYSRLKSNDLNPNPKASPAALLRRLFLDLTGLPPEPADVEAFLADPSPAAYARWVDQLLESPAYGERWGRYWLDLARYADSNGSDENLLMANAFRYRDYVIRSFNEDKPFDIFLKEQIAGDLLPEPENGLDERTLFDRWTALGFLALGPKVVAEQDKEKMIMDLVDEQMDVLTKVTLGLAIGCARCHDHKFDPISARDYYAMAGVFKSSRTMANRDHVSHWLERPLETPEAQRQREAIEQQIKAAETKVQDLESKLREQGISVISKLDNIEIAEADDDSEAAPVTEEELQLQSAQAELDQLRKQALPKSPTVLTVREANQVQDLKVHARGSHLNLVGDPVPRGTPKQFQQFAPASGIDPSGSGRLQLAEWLTHPEHPLTARVWVNRVWMRHFGNGLSLTPDNFGTTGDTPSHPDLLDWLANEFVESGWSTKRLHRQILLSAAYQMSADPQSDAMQSDPTNRLIWRINPRRMEAEALRDSILQISGRLDLQMQGTLVEDIGNYQYARSNESFNKVFNTTRRSVYLPVIRSTVYNYLQIFDFCDPSATSGKRASTTVSHQALFLMNSDFIWDNAQTLAKKTLSQDDMTDQEKLQWVYLKVYARNANSIEQERALQYLNEAAESPESAWTLLCQALLASNEFIYIY